MLRISKKADYAVFLLGAIARQGAYPGGSAEDSVVSAHEIARLARLNKSVVANLLKDFARDGLLESVRGLRGGYRLAQRPADITLGRILEVVEGKFVLVDCVSHGDASNGDTSNGDASSDDASERDDDDGDQPSELLPLAPSQQAANGDSAHLHGRGAGKGAGQGASQGASQGDCALISFCPSKRPMRIVHARIQKLFDDIHLDELCALDSTVHGAANARSTIDNGTESRATVPSAETASATACPPPRERDDA